MANISSPDTGTETAAPPVNEDAIVLPLHEGDSVKIRDCFEGIQIFGATGSGKTSGSGSYVRTSMLSAGMGGFVAASKPSDLEDLKADMLAAKRSLDDLVILEPGGNRSFGFFEYERRVSQYEGLPVTENIVDVFMVLFEISMRKSSGSSDAYWRLAVEQLVRNAVTLMVTAKKPLTFPALYRLVTSAPASPEAAEQALAALDSDNRTLFVECLSLANDAEADPSLDVTVAYWIDEFPKLAPETRSSIVSYFTTIADKFARGELAKLFAPPADPQNEFSPELSRKGKVLFINLPIKRFGETGTVAQVLFKRIWQRAAERQAGSAGYLRPMFLWIDESQYFMTSQDMLFQTTARSSKVATVYLTQNISNYYAVMPGDRAKAETDSLLGNFNTKVFHANTDAVTNQWASDLIGKNWRFKKNLTSNVSSGVNESGGRHLLSLKHLMMSQGAQNTTSVTRGKTESLESQVLPLEFYGLAKGGPDNDCFVEAIFTQGGRILKDGKIYQKLRIRQLDRKK